MSGPVSGNSRVPWPMTTGQTSRVSSSTSWLARSQGVYGAQGVSDARVRPVPWIRLAVVVGVASPLACGGLELVGAGFPGQQDQRGQHGQRQQAGDSDREGAQDR